MGPLPPDEGRAAAALAALDHRGPDARGTHRFETPDGRHGLLLHARLAIIDLDRRADQPFADGPLRLVFNGEIYDYRERRAELEALGESFRTASDTEVLARLLRLRGIDGLDACEGMWAFAAVDESTGELTLCRDRFGEKPLFVLRADDGLYFASEPKAIAALSGRSLAPDMDQLARYLVNGYKALHKNGSTFFADLESLPCGTALHVGAGGAERRVRYWAPELRPEEGMAYEEAVAAARERLIRATAIRLRADVPLAFCMSGGVDSVALISVAARELGHEVHGFTVVNGDGRYDESAAVRAAAGELGVRNTQIPLTTEGFLPALRAQVREHDAPVATITYYAHRRLMDAVADAGYRVSVSGTAADELFSGYYDHHLAYLREVRDDPPLWRISRDRWNEHVRPFVRNPHLSDPDLFVRDASFRDHIYLNAPVFAERLRTPFAEPFAETAFVDDLLRNRMLNELFHEAVPVILAEDDLNAMARSIENRSPFLDRGLAELSWTIPTRHLVRDGAAKAVLRDAVAGIAPEGVIRNRRKVGFNAPIGALLDRADPDVRAELMQDSPLWDLMRPEAVEELLDRPGELPNSESKFLFSAVSAKMFLEECAA